MSTHGRRSTYTGGCRCLECLDADTAYQKARRAARAALPDEEKPHGTARCYTHYGCRCEACTKAARETVAANKKRRAA